MIGVQPATMAAPSVYPGQPVPWHRRITENLRGEQMPARKRGSGSDRRCDALPRAVRDHHHADGNPGCDVCVPALHIPG